MGTVFKLSPSGVLKTLVSFNGSNGEFYGVTGVGGDINYGMVFKVTSAGVFTKLVSFNRLNGRTPLGAPVLGNDGNFYGVTQSGGNGGNGDQGTVFKITPEGGLTTLVRFAVYDGSNPSAGLVVGSDGNFYGTTSKGGLNISIVSIGNEQWQLLRHHLGRRRQ